jgi:hypothetical protein
MERFAAATKPACCTIKHLGRFDKVPSVHSTIYGRRKKRIANISSCLMVTVYTISRRFFFFAEHAGHAACIRAARRWIHEDPARGVFDVVFAEWFALPLAIPHCQKRFWRVKGPRFLARLGPRRLPDPTYKLVWCSS